MLSASSSKLQSSERLNYSSLCYVTSLKSRLLLFLAWITVTQFHLLLLCSSALQIYLHHSNQSYSFKQRSLVMSLCLKPCRVSSIPQSSTTVLKVAPNTQCNSPQTHTLPHHSCDLSFHTFLLLTL